MKQIINVGFVGNPNCGKTTLFNAFTGANLKVANYPGVTVERKEGETVYKSQKMKLVDLPGIYSLTSYSIEEKVTRQSILEEDIDVIVNIVDASALERNLYLTLQLLELGKPVVLALNMMDIVEERGMELDLHRMPELLGNIPVVPISARKKTGLDVLLHAVKHHYSELPQEKIIDYGEFLEEKIDKIQVILKAKDPSIKNLRWNSVKLLENDEEVCNKYGNDVHNVIEKSYEKEIINAKYNFIEELIEEVLFHKQKKEVMTEKIDRILTHKIWGAPIFLCIMAFVFFLTFIVGNFLKIGFDVFLSDVSNLIALFLDKLNASEMIVSLVVDGIIAGVGGILSFLPNIAILFFALSILEDSGYMSRVAYVMDGIMEKIGLSGKAFLPMVLGFGCTVPAIMATRTLESEKDRRRAMLLTPFMSCSARLPIYVLFADMFFSKSASMVAFSLYVFGAVVAIAIAKVLHVFTRDTTSSNLLIELPEYKVPNIRTLFVFVWLKIKDYLTKAGTTIFVASVIIWIILNFNFQGLTHDISTSFGALIGRWMEPVLAPAGLGQWQIGVALLSGVSAKEVVVSSLSVLYNIHNINTNTGMSQFVLALKEVGFGALNAYSLMIFCLLYTPCVATIATIRKESNSLRFTLQVIFFQLIFAWAVSTIVYQIGSLLVKLF